MSNETKDTGFSVYVGISSPETPKYIILTNFMTRFFYTNDKYEYDQIVEWRQDNILSEEGDSETKAKLKDSFRAYFNAYSGFDVLKRSSRSRGTKRFFPITSDMLTSASFNLRHLLYTLHLTGKEKNISEDKEYKNTQEELYSFLFAQKDTTDIYQIFKYICGNPKRYDDIVRSKTDIVAFGPQKDEKYFLELAKHFNRQLHLILSNKELLQADFYRRMEFLSTFFSLYVLQFLLARTNNIQYSKNRKKNLIVCKGSTNLDISNDAFHRASQSCYVSIREQFPEMIKSYYKQQISEIGSDRIKLVKGAENSISVKYKKRKTGEEQKTELISFLEEYKLSISNTAKVRETLKEKVLEIFFKDNDKPPTYTKEEFAMEYYNMQKGTQGSSVAKLTSTLPTTGRDMNFLFPKSNARQKYFAMSGDVAEFFVRLYLIDIQRQYGYFDDFISWLEDNYKIFIHLDAANKLSEYLHTINSSVSVRDSNRNETSFIKTLLDINCLVKLSDSGYIIVTPEKKEEVPLL